MVALGSNSASGLYQLFRVYSKTCYRLFVENLQCPSVVHTRFQGTLYSASQVIGVVPFTPLSSRANRDHRNRQRMNCRAQIEPESGCFEGNCDRAI